MQASETVLPVLPAWERWFLQANRWALVLLFGAMSALVIANVIARYAFSFSFTWAEEVSRYMMIWASFLGLGPALRVGGHIAVESLPNALPASAARVLRVGLVAIMAVTLAVVIWLGWQYALFGWEQESPVLNWSLGQIYLAIPVGAALALAHLALVARSWIMDGEWERMQGFDPQAL